VGLKCRGSRKWAGMNKDFIIIELRKYNSAKELLIGHPNTRLQRQVINRNMEWRVFVAMVAVCMRRWGMEPGTRYRDACNQPPIQE